MSKTEASTSQDEASTDVDVEAAKLLSQGRRHLLDDAMKAVQCLQEACQLLGTKYGELADECGESYFYYGWALLEVARMETGVLGNALQGVDVVPEDEEAEEDGGGETDNVENPDKLEVEEKEKIFHDVQDALEDETEGQSETDKEGASEMETEEKEASKTEDGKEADDKASESKKAGEKEGEDAVGEESKDDASEKTSTAVEGKKDEDGGKPVEEKPMEVEGVKGKDEKQAENGSGKDETKEAGKDKSEAEEKTEDEGTADEGTGDEGTGDEGEEDGAKGEDTKDEDVSNFQLSWEMLELARLIFSKHDSDEFKLKVAQVYLKLGEHGLETGNYTQSVEDFTQCLTRQKEQLGTDSRLLAETHYNLALAYSFDQKFDKAIQNFEQSLVVIQNRIATLKKKAEDPDKPLSEEEAEQNKQEIAELEALVPEIKAKVEDAKTEKNSAESAVGQAMRAAAAEFGLGTSSSSGFASSSSSSGFGASCGETAKPIAVRKAPDTKPDDISHLVHRKRKPEGTPDQESSIKKSRQEDGSGDAASSTNKVNNATNGDVELANGDAKQSAETEEIKVKQVEQASNDSAETPSMET